MSPQETPAITPELLAELPELERRTLEVVAASIVSITRSQIAKALKSLGCAGARGRQLASGRLTEPLRGLGRRGLLRGQSGCAAEVIDPVTRLLRAEGRYLEVARAVSKASPLVCCDVWGVAQWKDRGSKHFVREIRIALHEGEWERALMLRTAARSEFVEHWRPLAEASILPLDLAWVDGLPRSVAIPLVAELLDRAIEDLEPVDALFPRAEAFLDASDDPELRQRFVEAALFAGRLEAAQGAIEAGSGAANASLGGLKLAIEGRYEEATKAWEGALRSRRKEAGKRNAFLEDRGAAFYPLALIAHGALEKAGQVARAADRSEGESAELAAGVERAVRVRGGGDVYWPSWARDDERGTSVEVLVDLLVRRASGRKLEKARRARAADVAWRAGTAGLTWLAREIEAVLGESVGGGEVGGVPWAEALKPAPEWRRRLDALLALSPTAPEARDTASEVGAERLAWFLDSGLSPKLQKRNKRGWTGGRKIALKRLYGQPDNPDLVTAADRKVLRHLERESYVDCGYLEESYFFSTPEAFVALIDHPLLFDAKSGAPATITRVEPTAKVSTKGRQLEITIEPKVTGSQGLKRIGDGRFRLTAFTDAQREFAAVVKGGLKIPVAQKAAIAAATELLAQAFPVAGSDAAVTTEGATELEADPGVRVLLEPEGEGLAVQLRVRPWAGGPALRPGAGGETVRHTRDGAPVVATRDLEAERAAAAALIGSCPALRAAGDLLVGDGHVSDGIDALRLVQQVGASVEPERLEWPTGRRVQIHEMGDDALQLGVSKARDWFQISGELRIDEELVLGLRDLLRAERQMRDRFLPLGGDRYLALDAELARYLSQLAAVAEESKGDRLRFHRLAVPALVDAIEGLGAKTGKAWKARVAELVPSDEAIELPTTFRAELRPYQDDGYRWLATLATWGAGACLADDMGLGKTVQALALLTRRAADGPALVVAPTSVVEGWRREALRFAPTLRVSVFGRGDRAAHLAGLGPNDVLLCSYGLLATESEQLATVDWATAVLDEAQAIKNPATARAKAAYALQARVRLALTGTPVENRLLDLWSLFRFLNPGLLGALAEFKTRFSGPIERGGDPHARGGLSALVKPFVLRRTKTAVLQELPPRTERLLPVVLGQEEASLYEALRREALEQVGDGGDTMTILGWLTKLRLACCNPALAGVPGLPSSKLAAFMELVSELKEGDHRALVFSQFVRHLDLVREALDAQGVGYRYIDGSMTPKARQREVDQFQAGEGRLFLISLKAGGTGLNLTAADNVIHLDPWWNPAVEDQASDRAHRIGQRRPVTVHRLVAQGTIEEEITALHHTKRALADSVLAGTDTAARLSPRELVELLRGESPPPTGGLRHDGGGERRDGVGVGVEARVHQG